ncbi:hypothetical protein [Methyloglobulus sp.]|uniref:hypothetical protein n=1 Tax=Methyloglobulus sp. TaxID=2518622 RepID=UPI0032B7A8F1
MSNINIIGGLINGLLTGGILIGKICQALGGGQNNKIYVDEESGVTVIGDVSSGGIKFFRSDASGNFIVYAFNPDTTSPVMVTIPNVSDASGVTYIVQPTHKVPIGEVDSPLVSPTINVTTGPTDSPVSNIGAAGARNSLFKLAFSGLGINNKVTVGSFMLTCTTTQLIIVSTQITATALSYMWFQSNKGVTVSSQNRIPPATTPSINEAGEVEQRFSIDFAALGIDINFDIIDGQVTLEAETSPDVLIKLSKAPSEPLHPSEREFFIRLSRGEL